MAQSSIVNNAATYGFNAKTGEITLKCPIFNISNSGSSCLELTDGLKIDYPAQVKMSACNTMMNSSQSTVINTVSDYTQALSVSVGVSDSGIGYSAALSSSYFKNEHLFQSSNSSYLTTYHIQEIAKFTRTGKTTTSGTTYDLTVFFKNAVSMLPVNIDSIADIAKYNAFFELFGTHYVDTAYFGGYVVYSAIVDSDLFEKSSSSAVSSSFSASIDDYLVDGHLQISGSFDSSSFHKSYKKDTSVYSEIVGGTMSAKLSDWVKSLYSSNNDFQLLFGMPNGEVLTELKSISELITIGEFPSYNVAAIVKNINELIMQYTQTSAPSSSNPLIESAQAIFPYAKQFNTNTSYPPNQFNGYFVAGIYENADKQRGVLKGSCSNNVDSGVDLGLTSQQYESASNLLIRYSTLSFPVPMSNKPQVTFEALQGKPIIDLLGYNFNQYSQLPEWEELDISNGKLYSLEKYDQGFVIVTLDYNHQDSASHVLLMSGNTTIAGASQYYNEGKKVYLHYDSFCVPIATGQGYQLQYFKTSGNPIVSAYFVKLPNNMLVNSVQSIDINVAHQEMESDGFVTTVTHASKNESHCYSHIYACPPTVNIENLGSIARAAVQNNSHVPVDMPYRSITIPIPYGYNLKTKFDADTKEMPSCHAFWTGINKYSLKILDTVTKTEAQVGVLIANPDHGLSYQLTNQYLKGSQNGYLAQAKEEWVITPLQAALYAQKSNIISFKGSNEFTIGSLESYIYSPDLFNSSEADFKAEIVKLLVESAEDVTFVLDNGAQLAYLSASRITGLTYNLQKEGSSDYTESWTLSISELIGAKVAGKLCTASTSGTVSGNFSIATKQDWVFTLDLFSDAQSNTSQAVKNIETKVNSLVEYAIGHVVKVYDQNGTQAFLIPSQGLGLSYVSYNSQGETQDSWNISSKDAEQINLKVTEENGVGTFTLGNENTEKYSPTLNGFGTTLEVESQIFSLLAYASS